MFCVRILGRKVATLSENCILVAHKSIGLSQSTNPARRPWMKEKRERVRNMYRCLAIA